MKRYGRHAIFRPAIASKGTACERESSQMFLEACNKNNPLHEVRGKYGLTFQGLLPVLRLEHGIGMACSQKFFEQPFTVITRQELAGEIKVFHSKGI